MLLLLLLLVVRLILNIIITNMITNNTLDNATNSSINEDAHNEHNNDNNNNKSNKDNDDANSSMNSETELPKKKQSTNILNNSINSKDNNDNKEHKLHTINSNLKDDSKNLIRMGSNNSLEEEPYEQANRHLIKREKICDTDTEDSASDDEKETPYLIYPESTFKKVWVLLISCILMYSAIYTPFRIAFYFYEDKYKWFDFLIDACLWVDIPINFISPYIDEEETLIKNRKQIAQHYLKTWFIIDFCSSFPFFEVFKSKNTYKNAFEIPLSDKYLKLTNLIRIIKISKGENVSVITKLFSDKLKINVHIKNLFFFLIAYFLLNHVIACMWYFIAILEDFEPRSWVIRLGYVDQNVGNMYLICMYWSLATTTMVGYGDISAGTTEERIYNMFIMFFGVLMSSFLIGLLSLTCNALYSKYEEINAKLGILDEINKANPLHPELYEKVRKTIKYDLGQNQRDKMQFLQELPNKLRLELSHIMHNKAMRKLNFFKDQPNDFFVYTAPFLKSVKFFQNDYLYKIGEQMQESNNIYIYI